MESGEPDVADNVKEEIDKAKKKRKYTKREDIQYLRKLSDKFQYSKILAHFRDDRGWSWPEAAILSEIDVVMIETKKPCYSGQDHYAQVGRVGHGGARNILSKFTTNGIIKELGYHPGKPTKDRIVSPEYSSNPELSRQIINQFRK
jgi:hypothetical protein